MDVALFATGAGVAVGGAVLAMGAGWFVQRYIPLENRQENNDVAGLAFAIIGVLYAMVLTFVIVSVWESNDAAEDQARQEVRALIDVRRYADTLDPATGTQLRTDADRYVAVVTGTEWPLMRSGKPVGGEGAALVDQLWRVVDTVHPADDAGVSRQEEARDDLRTLEESREARIAAAGGGLPGVMWLALLVGAALTLGNALIFGVKGSGEYYALVGMVAAISVLMLYGVYEMEYPYQRGERVGPDVVTSTYQDLTT